MPSNPRPEEGDLKSYLRVLNRRKLTVALVTSIMLAGGLGISFVQKPSYTATTQVLLPAESAASALQPANLQLQPAAELLLRVLSDAQHFATGDQTKQAAQALLHQAAAVTVGTTASADILTFTATNGRSTEAAKIANTYAQAFITQYVANQVSKYTGQVTALQASIAKLSSTGSNRSVGPQEQAAATASINSLTQALQQLQAASQLVRNTAPSVVNAAIPPSSPSSPKPVRTGVLGLFLGLLLGLGVAFVRDHLDDKVDSLRDVEENSESNPVVGVIPLVESWRRDTAHHLALVEDSGSNIAEAYRTLRTSIQFLGLEESQRVIGITSSTANEGKSTATANVAVSFASAGQRVIALSFDFRRPRLHRFFGLDNQVGATSVILGQVPLQDALQNVKGQPNLRILASGPVPPNPAEILSLDRVRQLVATLADNADIVIIDCPPVLPVSDTLLISRLCDSLYVLMVASSTTKNNLRRTYTLLSQVSAPARGTIINKVSATRGDASGYGYGYGYYDYSPEDESKEKRILPGRRPKAPANGERREASLGRIKAGVGADRPLANGDGQLDRQQGRYVQRSAPVRHE